MVVSGAPRARRAASQDHTDASAQAHNPSRGASAAAQVPGRGAFTVAQALDPGASAAAQGPGDDALARGALSPTPSGSPMRRVTRCTAAQEQDANADERPAEAPGPRPTSRAASLGGCFPKPFRFRVRLAGGLVRKPDRDGLIRGAEAVATRSSIHAAQEVSKEKMKEEASQRLQMSKKCTACAIDFSISKHMHYCRKCGETFCGKCSSGRIALTTDLNAPLVRVCDKCLSEVERRFKLADEAYDGPSTLPKEVTKKCTTCAVHFGLTKRMHRCRKCGETFCGKCSRGKIALTADHNARLVRICAKCLEEVSQTKMAKEASNVSATMPKEVTKKCTACTVDFSLSKRAHHCRKCGEIFCGKCSRGKIALTSDLNAPRVRVCYRCLEEIGNMAKEAASRSATVQSPDDLARKLKVVPDVKENGKHSTARLGEVLSSVPVENVAINTRSTGQSNASSARLKHNITVATDLRVALIYDSRMLEHAPPEGAVFYERPERLTSIMQKLMKEGIADRCKFFEPDLATTNSLHAVHTLDYVEEVESLSKKSQEEMDAKALQHDPDGGTYYCRESTKAALLAAGSAIKACDLVAKGEFEFSFALVRPPGHHVGKDGPPSGFCLLNNAAVGPAHLLEKHQMKKILILDWDVHHGNGTQDIFFDDNRVLFFSVHRFNDDDEFFPYTLLSSLDSVGAGPGSGYNINVCWRRNKIRDADYIAVWDHLLLPVIEEFEPEIIIISAGFDVAKGDPLGECDVTPGGFAYLLEKLMPHPIVMVLEGGYDLSAIQDSVAACVRTLLGEKCGNVNKRCLPYDTTWTMIENTWEKHKLSWRAYAKEIPKAVSSRSKRHR